MKRFIFILFTSCISIFCYADAFYQVIAHSLNVREAPSMNAEKIGSLTQGQIVTVFSMDGEWAIIDYKDKFGYVSVRYLELDQSSKTISHSSDIQWEPLDTISPDEFSEFALNQAVPENVPESKQTDSHLNEPCYLLGMGIGYSYLFGKVDGKLQNEGAHGFPLCIYVNWEIDNHMGVWGDLGYEYYSSSKNHASTQSHFFCMDTHFSLGGDLNPNMRWIIHGGPGMMIMCKSKSYYNNKEISSSDKARFDLQFGLGTAFAYKNIAVSFMFNWGLLDMNRDVKDAQSSYQRNLNISLIYTIF